MTSAITCIAVLSVDVAVLLSSVLLSDASIVGTPPKLCGGRGVEHGVGPLSDAKFLKAIGCRMALQSSSCDSLGVDIRWVILRGSGRPDAGCLSTS